MATNDKGDRTPKGRLDALRQALGRASGRPSGSRGSGAWRSKLDRGEADSYHERMTAEREMRRMSSLWHRLFPIDYDEVPLAGYEQMPDGVPEGVDESLLVPSIAEEAIAAGLGLEDKGEEEPPPVAETHSDTSNRNTVMFGSNALATLLSGGGHGRRRPSEIPDEPDGDRLPGTLGDLYDEAHGLLDSIPAETRSEPEPKAREEEEKPVEVPVYDDEQSDEAAREWAEIETEIADAKDRVASGLDAIDALSESKPRNAHDAGNAPAEPVEEELDEEALQALEAEVVAKVAAAKAKEGDTVDERSQEEEDSPDPTVVEFPSEEEDSPNPTVVEPEPTASVDSGEPAERTGMTGRLHALLGMLPFAAGDRRQERKQEAADATAARLTQVDAGEETVPMSVADDAADNVRSLDEAHEGDATQPLAGMPDDATQPLERFHDDTTRSIEEVPGDATRPFDGIPDDATQPIEEAHGDATQPFDGVPDDATQPFGGMPDAIDARTGGRSGAVPQAASGRIGFLEAVIPADGNFAMPLAEGTVKAKVKVMPVQGILLGGHARQARSRGSSSVRLRVRASKVNLQSISLIGPGQGYVPVDSPVGTNCRERIEPKVPKMRRIGEPADGTE